ncbi:hypothetical protein HY994_04295 [Candidatus Micrarchaeota archaeon]|nr:hypothetical protein [Candidatus Micrarchaeota archaeon]
MSLNAFRTVVASLFVMMLIGFAAAAIPVLIPLQGKLLNATGNVLNGSQTINFTILDAVTGGNQLWQEVRSGVNNVSVTNGFFDVNLGDNTSLSSVNFTGPTWLEINVSGEILTPRMRLASAPYARTSERVFGVGTLNESLVTLNKTATGSGAVLNILQNSGTGNDISAPVSFFVRSGAVNATNYTGASSAPGFIGNGTLLTSLDASNLSTGTVSSGRISGTYSGEVVFSGATNNYTGSSAFAAFRGNGSALTSLDASQIVNGTLGDTRLVGVYTSFLTFSGSFNNYTGYAAMGSFRGNGSTLTSLDASQLVNGTVADGRISGTYTGALVFSGSNNNYTGSSYIASFRGNGSALTSLDASNLVNGTVPAARLGTSTVYVFNGSSVNSLDASNLVNGTLADGRLSGSYTGALVLSGTNNNYTGSSYIASFRGNGSALTSLDASNLVNGTLGDARFAGVYSFNVNLSNPSNKYTGLLGIAAFVGNGSALTSLDASNLANGTLPAARLSGVYGSNANFSNANNLYTGLSGIAAFVGNGSALTSLDASNLANGTVADGRISGTYTGALVFSGANNNFTGSSYVASFRGNGSALTSLDASQLVNGTLADGRLSGAYTGTTNFSNANNKYTGLSGIAAFVGNGSALTSLDASNLANGTVADGRISGTYSGNLVFSGANNNYTGAAYYASFRGNGSALTNLDASNIINGTIPSSVLVGGFNGSAIFSLDASNLANGTVASGRISGTYSSDVWFSGANNNYTGATYNASFRGNGSALTSLDASNLANGTVGSGRISGTYTGGVFLNNVNNNVTVQNLTTNSLELRRNGFNNVTVASATGNGNWIGGADATARIYGNGSTDGFHSESGVTIPNSAVTASSLIFISPYNACTNCTYNIGARYAGIGFDINVTNGTTRGANVDFAYVFVN